MLFVSGSQIISGHWKIFTSGYNSNIDFNPPKKTRAVVMQVIRTKKAEITLLREDFIQISIFENVHLEAKDIRIIHEEKIKLVGSKKHVVLLIAGRYSTISLEARELSASSEMTGNRVAIAIIARSIAHRLVGNFFIRVNKPPGNTRIFSSKERATKWLEKFL